MKKIKKVSFRVSVFDQNLLDSIFEDADFGNLLHLLGQYAIVDLVDSPQELVPFYRYSFVLDSDQKRNFLLDFGSSLIEYSQYLLIQNEYQSFLTCRSFGRKLLKCLI